MTAHEFIREYRNLTPTRQVAGMETFLKILGEDVKVYESFLQDVLDRACDYEQDDYFGTEGLDI